MTDPTDDDEAREFVRHLFGDASDAPPRDVVPGAGPTREDYLRWNEQTGTASEAPRHGEPILDANGIPTAMPAPTTETVVFGGVAATVEDLAAVGLTPEDVPNIHIIPTTGDTDE